MSSKGENGAGIGLALAEMMVEKRLSGTIEASNKESGACFEMVLNSKC